MKPIKILVIKTSSLGDVIHCLPAIYEASKNLDITIDWAIEPDFKTIAKISKAVNQVIALPIRAWRKNLFKIQTWRQIKSFLKLIKKNQYTHIIDAQGLLKTAIWLYRCKAITIGFDKKTVREPLAAMFYKQKINVNQNQHAIFRLKGLFAKALGYGQSGVVDYGIDLDKITKQKNLIAPDFITILSTTWQTKEMPDTFWYKIFSLAKDKKLTTFIPWGNVYEKKKISNITTNFTNLQTADKLYSLEELIQIFSTTKVILSVDTGLAHLAAALSCSVIVLYRVTDPKLVGTIGCNTINLTSKLEPKYIKKFSNAEQVSDSLKNLEVDKVWELVASRVK